MVDEKDDYKTAMNLPNIKVKVNDDEQFDEEQRKLALKMKKIKQTKDKAIKDGSGNRFKITKKVNNEELKFREKRSQMLKQALDNLKLIVSAGLQMDPAIRK